MLKPKPERFRIGTAYKRLLACGCSHGEYLDPIAADAVIAFRRRFKPDYCIHLGDVWDTQCLRTGATGTKDEDADLNVDLQHGIDFLKKLKPTHLTLGNHDWRFWKALEHRWAAVRTAAKACIGEIDSALKELKCKRFDYRGNWSFTEPGLVLQIGNYRFAHGSFFGENATRDYAECYGNVVHAHTHRAAMAKGRRADSPTAFAVGTLADPRQMTYAELRRATMAWSAGLVYGEVAMRRRPMCYLVLAERPRGAEEWRLPI